MKAEVYGEALYGAICAGTTPQEAFVRLRAVLKRHGRAPLYRAALRDAESRFARDEQRSFLRVTVAQEKDIQKYEKEIAAFAKEVGATKRTVTVDASIIGGYIATGAGRERDASYRRSLLAIYKSLTA